MLRIPKAFSAMSNLKCGNGMVLAGLLLARIIRGDGIGSYTQIMAHGAHIFFFCPNKNSCPVRLLDDEGLGEKLYGHEIKCGRPLPDPSPIIDCLPHITLMDQKRRSCMAPKKSILRTSTCNISKGRIGRASIIRGLFLSRPQSKASSQ